jgi:hypothetical protein
MIKLRLLAITANLLAVCASPSLAQTIPPTGPETPTIAEKRRAASLIMNHFADPDSVMIANLTFTRLGAAAVFCGRVNAKNRMGAYTGLQPFVIFAGQVTIGDGRPGTRQTFERFENMTCNGGVRVPISPE